MLPGMLAIDCIETGPFSANCYLVRDSANAAVLIDPGAEPAALLKALEHRRLTLAAYLITHGHADHVGALADLYARHPVPYAMSDLDYRWAFTSANELLPYYPAPRQPSRLPILLEDRQTWNPVPELSFLILATPGHSPGSLCAYLEAEGVIFTGDTLFQDTVGRTDIPGGDQVLLQQSLQTLAQLPPATRIYPGHGPATTLEQELRANPYLTH